MNELLPEQDDKTVIKRILDGETEAYALLVNKYRHHVASIAARHVPAQSVQEVAQDTFVRAHGSLKTFKGIKPFEHWLSVIAVRACRDFWRVRYRRREIPLSTLSESGRCRLENAMAEDAAVSFEDEAVRKEAIQLLHRALAALSPDDRTVLTLTHLEERSTAETAELTGLSRANVKVRAFRARKKLRAFLKKEMEGTS